MPRPNETERYELSDAEKRDLIKLIKEGKPLPEQYRFLLFEDKREVELVWNGKTREVCTAILPFQTLEHIDEPRKERGSDASPEVQEEMFSGRQVKGWTNKLIWGDNKLILSSLKSGALRRQIEEAGGLKLIYIDPPFDVGADFSMDIEIGGETFHKEPNLLEQIAYRDTWAVDFDYESRKEIIKVAKNFGVEGALPGMADSSELLDFEERWTGAYIFENEWQSFRTRKDRELELTTASHTYDTPGRYTLAVKVIDIFGNDTMTLIPVTVG